MLKQLIQKLVRLINLILFKRQLPNKISIYFHETNQKELESIEKIIEYFIDKDYKFLTISEFNKNIDTNEKNLAFTFDDGFSNWCDVLPIFKKYDIKATFYMNTIQFTSEKKGKFLSDIKCKDEKLLINENELDSIQKAGHEIGAHTHSHRTLKNINKEEFIFEISENLKVLNSYNIYPKNFAIPFGMRRYATKYQIQYLLDKFDSVAYGEPGMLFTQKISEIQRYPWKIEESFQFNINNISTNTSLFNNLTKRSGLG